MMWKKNDTANVSPPRKGTSPSANANVNVNVSPPATKSASHAQAKNGQATIGPTVTVKGEISGDENLLIEGSVEGKVMIRRHLVTVGERGRVAADIEAANVRVAGEVRGNLTGTDQVVLLATGRVEGDIKAGNVTLENGARFKGSIDMETAEKTGAAQQRQSDAQPQSHSQSQTGAGAGTSSSPSSKPNGSSASGSGSGSGSGSASSSPSYGSRA
jgi:cytoskeletal protein CcmA (bactofilin family)